MSARRLHAVCPHCNPVAGISLRTHPLHADGRMVQHTTWIAGRECRCSGSDMVPLPEAVRAWLASYEGEAIEHERNARQAHTRTEAVLAAAQQERADRAAWCAQQRGAL